MATSSCVSMAGCNIWSWFEWVLDYQDYSMHMWQAGCIYSQRIVAFSLDQEAWLTSIMDDPWRTMKGGNSYKSSGHNSKSVDALFRWERNPGEKVCDGDSVKMALIIELEMGIFPYVKCQVNLHVRGKWGFPVTTRNLVSWTIAHRGIDSFKN